MSLLLIPVLAQAIAVNAGDRTEVRFRNSESGQAVDAMTRGTLTLTLATRRANYGLSYSPVLTEWDVGSRARSLTLQHTGTLRGGFQLSPRTYAFFSESLSYGQQNFRLVALSAVPRQLDVTGNENTAGTGAVGGVQSTPVGSMDRTIRFASTSTQVGVAYQLSPLWQSTALASYSISTGLDATSRLQMPRYQAISSDLGLLHNLTRRDRLDFALNLTRTKTGSATPTGAIDSRDALMFTLASSLQRQFSQHVSGGLSVGGAIFRSETTTAVSDSLAPVGAANLRLNGNWKHARLSAGATQQFAPIVDRLTGTVSNRASTGLSFNWTKDRVTAGATAQTSTSIGDAQQSNALRYSYMLGEFVGYQLRRHWHFELGCRQAWLSFANVPTAPMMWTVYLAASYTTENLPL